MTRKRLRQRRNRSLAVALAGLFIFIVAVGALVLTLRVETLKVAVGPAGGNDAKLVEEMARTFARERDPVRLSVVISDSAETAARLFREGKVNLAVMRSDELAPQARAIAILRKNALVLWAPAKRGQGKGAPPKIEKIQQLAGQKIGLLGRAVSNMSMLKAALEASGVPPDKIEVKIFASADAGALAVDPTLAAFATVGPSDSKLTAEAIASTVKTRGEPVFLAIDAAEALAKKLPQFETAEIPASSFSSAPARPDDEVETIGVNHLIAANQKLSENVAAALTRQIFTQRQALLKELPGFATLEKPDTDKDSAIPVHPGAAAYIDGTERTFLEKYSDYMWGALLLASGIGSGFASLRAFFKRDEKAEHLILRERLLAYAADARECSMDVLVELERGADEILQSTIRFHDDGALTDGELAAFGLILQHFRKIVADRKRQIAEAPAGQVRGTPPSGRRV